MKKWMFDKDAYDQAEDQGGEILAGRLDFNPKSNWTKIERTV